MTERKGQTGLGIGMMQMAKENKESAITASILLYAAVYIVMGMGGISFQAQPALAYTVDTGNSCTDGSLWVENGRLHWCEGSEHYRHDAGGGDRTYLNDGSSSDPDGSIWISGNDLYWVDSDGDEYGTTGDYVTSSGDPEGSIWVENNYLHYVDDGGDERRLSWEGP